MENSLEINVTTLLEKPVWQMTGREFCALTQFANETQKQSCTTVRKLCVGTKSLADYLSCSEAKVYLLKKEGILKEAIVSKIGKKTVFDGEMARSLANAKSKNHE